MGCPACIITPKFEITYSKTGIALVPLTIKYLGKQHALEVADGWDPTSSSTTAVPTA